MQCLTSAVSVNLMLKREFWEYCHTDESSNRVGEFAIGSNIGLCDVIGNILQDEKIPGIRILFGNRCGTHTGAPWSSNRNVDVVGLVRVRFLDVRPAHHASWRVSA